MSGKNISLGKTNAAILNGELDLSVWSDEELVRGQRRDRNGRWQGRPPKVVPKALYDELVKRKLSAASDLLRENTYAAVQALTEIATDRTAENRDRLKAVEMILDRVYGKEVLNVNVAVKARYEEVIASAIVSLPAGMVEAIEAQVHEPEADSDRADLYDN